MGKAIKIISEGNLVFGPQETWASNYYTHDFFEAFKESAYSYKSEDSADYAKIALCNKYLGELRERYGLKSIPFVWREDERPIKVQEPRILQNISEFFWELIQKAKEDPEHHYILDSTLGTYDADGFLEVKDQETLEKIIFDSREAVRTAEREYNELLKAKRTDELRKIGLPIMNAINEYKNKKFRESPESVIKMVKERGLELEYVGEEAKNNLQVVKAAIKQSPSAVKHAGKALLKNPESVIELLRETGYTYDVLNDRFKNNESFLAEALMGYISRGGKLTDETGYDYQYYDDEPPYWITTELFNIIDANRQLIAEKIKKKNIFYDSTDYSQALSEETIHYLEGLLEKYKTCEDKKRNNGVVVTHFGDDLDSKGAIYAIENWLRTQGLIDDDMRIILQRIPAGQAKETHDISEVAEAVDGVTLEEYNATATETRDGMKPTPEIGKKGLKHDDDDEQSI